jgi:transposase InsO family protein
LVTYYILFVIGLKSRRVEIAGVTTNPNTAWVTQVARNLTDHEDGFLRHASYLILDRDSSFLPLRKYLTDYTPVQPVVLPPRSPNPNAYAERFARTIKSECLDRMIFFSERSLRRALSEFVKHYHAERNHQGLENRLIEPDRRVGAVSGDVRCRERLGGLLRYYHRDAA